MKGGSRRTGPLRRRLALAAERRLTRAGGLLLRLRINLLDVVEGPRLVVDESRARQYDDALTAAAQGGGLVDYRLPYPKHEFLSYVVHHRGLLAHGSNLDDIVLFEPRQANDAGTYLTGVYAADDGIWPMFFAIVARGGGRLGLYNGSHHVGRGDRLRRFYLFSITKDPGDPASWTTGTVYLLPRETFRHIWGNEWVSDVSVRPLARLSVRPDDFPFRQATVRFSIGEPLWRIRRRFRKHARSTLA